MFFLFLPLFWLKIGINTHESSDPADILISKSFKVFQDAQLRRFGPYIKQNAIFWVKLSTKSLKEPEMRRKFGSIGVFKAADDFEFIGVIGFGTPLILVNKGKIFLDGWRKIIVVFDKVTHAFPLKVLHFINNYVNPFI